MKIKKVRAVAASFESRMYAFDGMYVENIEEFIETLESVKGVDFVEYDDYGNVTVVDEAYCEWNFRIDFNDEGTLIAVLWFY